MPLLWQDHNGEPKESSTPPGYPPSEKLAGGFADGMTIEQSELERENVPIVARCFRGCGTRAVMSDGFSNFCATCALAILKAEAIRLRGLAA